MSRSQGARKAGKASADARREKRERLKQEFLAIIRTGVKLTQTGIVSPRTYQTWRKEDPEFSAQVDKIVQELREARPKKVYKRKSRAKVYGPSVLESLHSDRVYAQAKSLLKGRRLAPDIEEAALSELVIMILSGEEPNPGKAVHAAKAEFLPHASYYERNDYAESEEWEYLV